MAATLVEVSGPSALSSPGITRNATLAPTGNGFDGRTSTRLGSLACLPSARPVVKGHRAPLTKSATLRAAAAGSTRRLNSTSKVSPGSNRPWRLVFAGRRITRTSRGRGVSKVQLTGAARLLPDRDLTVVGTVTR